MFEKNSLLVLANNKFNSALVPEKIKDLCIEANYNYTTVHLPYLSLNAFDLFMNLIITPRDIKIYNPQNLTYNDLLPVLSSLTYDYEQLKIKALIARLTDDEKLDSILEEIKLNQDNKNIKFDHEKNGSPEPECCLI